MSAPRLSLDDARSFEVPCTFEGFDTTVSIDRGSAGWVTHSRRSEDVQDLVWLGIDGKWLTYHEADDRADGDPVARLPSAQEALDAAFATDQIEPRGDQG